MNAPLVVLVAEDDPSDIQLLKLAFAKAGRAPSHYARDGQEVVDYLSGNPPFENPVRYPLPHLLLLDLNLPILDGFEVLRWIRNHPGLRHLIVVVLSGSERPSDIDRAYELGANSYVVKPRDAQQLVAAVQRLETYWSNLNVMPTGISVTSIISGSEGQSRSTPLPAPHLSLLSS